MKMRADRIEGQNAIARHGPEGVVVNGVEHTESVVVPWRGEVVRVERRRRSNRSRADHFARIAALAPELVIFGSGARLRFPAPALLRPLIDAGIGVETMDTRGRLPHLQRPARRRPLGRRRDCFSSRDVAAVR